MSWVEDSWRRRDYSGTEQFLAMTSLVRLHQLMADVMSAALKPYELTLNSYFLMLSVHLSDNGALLLSRIASRIMVHPTTVTMLMDRLESQGLLVREPHPTDRRATFAKITPAGSALVNQATRDLGEIDFGLPALSKAAAKQLVSMIQPIRAALGDLSGAD